MEIGKHEKILMEKAIPDLVENLTKDSTLRHARMNSFDYYNEKTDEVYQVHILVTRDESDFLDFLQTELMH